MTGMEVGFLGNRTSGVAGILQQLGNNYYASSSAWKEFPSQVKLLQERHRALAAQLEKYGQDIGPALAEAEKLMLEEVKALEKGRSREETSGGQKLCGIGSRVTKRVMETLFPEKIGLAMGDAIKAYDKIEDYLRLEVENQKNIRSLASDCPIPLPFCDDNFYVPLEQTEASISSSLNQSQREVALPTVVLLYGGPGTGKSTVSRQITLKYRSDSTYVVWLGCGPSQDPISMGLKLLQNLGWSDDLAEITGQSHKLLWEGSTQSRLKNLLRTRELLIVLDDLHDPQLLQDLLILSESNVKYLVTSQRDDICDNLSGSFTSKIQIENLGVDEPNSKNIVKKLLAIHSGYLMLLAPVQNS